mgnify:CR=1 FL=1
MCNISSFDGDLGIRIICFCYEQTKDKVALGS